MKFSFPRISRFVAPLYALKDLNDALHIVFSKTECRAIVMDVSHVSVSFVAWDCSGEMDSTNEVTIAIKLSNLLTALGLAKDSGDPFSLDLDSAESDTITLSMDDGDTVVQLRLFDADAETMSPPSFDDAVTCVFDTSRFKDVCKELASIGDTVAFSSDGTTLQLQTSGDVANARITLRPISITNPAPFEPLSISLRYLNSILKGYTVSQRLGLSFLESMPLRMALHGGDVHMETFIAPKLDMDTEE
jgi:hypothetical protein